MGAKEDAEGNEASFATRIGKSRSVSLREARERSKFDQDDSGKRRKKLREGESASSEGESPGRIGRVVRNLSPGETGDFRAPRYTIANYIVVHVSGD